MDLTFWVGIAIGAFISLAASFAANFYTDQLRDYLQQRSVIRLSRQRSRELKTHAKIVAIRNGYPAAIADLTECQFMAIMACFVTVLGLGLLCTMAALKESMKTLMPHWTFVAFAIIVTVMIGLASFLASVLMMQSRSTMRKLLRFSRYEQQIREKWGDDAI